MPARALLVPTSTATRSLACPDARALAVKISPYKPAERYILFEFEVERVLVTEYPEGHPVRRQWKAEE